ncbi:hypothetical protein OD91_0853 [Lutibacter sp. Hel_I_33_5]|uniref:hypothetical protein n=1 Tax=Lutibacter sp. Hel_I_33_5 TaxID=1566289 RepID=UPI0011A31F75|nr:hypothetical protein [Lutibacter sp. Hel_I_33_5]TVZ55598.1 hypothetical protein OD91_0853 [Lutibacter sp. Hel_I_33_5]
MHLTINGKKYPVKFGFGATRRIVEFYDYSKPSDFGKLVKKYKLDKLEDPSFEQYSFLGQFFKCAVLNAGAEDDFSVEDVLDTVMKTPNAMENLIAEFTKSQIKEPVNPESRGN